MKSPFLRRFGLPSPFFDNETSFDIWLLLTGFWSDVGRWDDTQNWNDGA